MSSIINIKRITRATHTRCTEKKILLLVAKYIKVIYRYGYTSARRALSRPDSYSTILSVRTLEPSLGIVISHF